MEADLLLWIQNVLRNPFCDRLMTGITHLGNSAAIWIVIAAVLMINRRRSERGEKIGLTILIALMGSLLVNNLFLKHLIARTRPYEVIEGLHILIAAPRDFSFPSGHAGSSFAAAAVIAFMAPKRYGIAALALAAVISFSRLYVGVHYPSDVLAGLFDGIFIGFLSVCLARGTFAAE